MCVGGGGGGGGGGAWGGNGQEAGREDYFDTNAATECVSISLKGS